MPTPSTDASIQQQQHQQQLQQERTARAGSPDAGGDTSDTMRFRAPTLEEAIALAETSLGARVRVVAANRIRRGGIGGFFASDLGVEVTVALDDETMEQALERIVAESAADERTQFESRLAQQLGVRPASLGSSAAAMPTAPVPVVPARPSSGIGGRFDQRDDEPTPAVNAVLSEVLAALMAEAAEQQQVQQQVQQTNETQQAERAAASIRAAEEQARADERERAIAAELATAFAAAARAAEEQVDGRRADQPTATVPSMSSMSSMSSRPAAPPTMIVAPSTVADTARRPVYDTPPTMVRVEQIIEELSAITAEPVFGGDRGRGRVARPIGVQRVSTDAAEAADATSAAARATTRGADVTGTAASDPPTVHEIHEIHEVAPAPQAAPVAERPKVLPTLPPRPGEIARAASAASAANHTRVLASPANLVAPARRVAPVTVPTFAPAAAAGPAAASPWPGRAPAPQTQAAVRPIPTLTGTQAAPPVAADAVESTDLSDRLGPTVPGDDDQAEMARMAESVRRALRGEHDPGLVSAVDRDATEGTVHASLEIDADLLDGAHRLARAEDLPADRGRQITSSRVPGSSSAPSRRQVELAVAATDQLIESLKRDDGVKRLSVRVVLRTGDQREVEAEAEWEAS